MAWRLFGWRVISASRSQMPRAAPTSTCCRNSRSRDARSFGPTHTQGLITVCQALKDELVALDIPDEKVRVLRNGVDLEMFRPVDRAAARKNLGLTGRTLLSVGLLIGRKGHDLIVSALRRLPDTTLLIVGDGPGRANLEKLAADEGVTDRVRF